MGVLCLVPVFFCALLGVLSGFAVVLASEERVVCFDLVIFLVSCDFWCFVAFSHGAVFLSAVCVCGIS